MSQVEIVESIGSISFDLLEFETAVREHPLRLEGVNLVAKDIQIRIFAGAVERAVASSVLAYAENGVGRSDAAEEPAIGAEVD